MRSSRKLRLLMADHGPICEGKFVNADEICEFLKSKVDVVAHRACADHHKTATIESITPHLIWRWTRDGVVRTRGGDVLSLVCTAVVNILNINVSHVEMARWIVDD